ncbi:MAG: response regulator [Pseudomonadota bacterium]
MTRRTADLPLRRQLQRIVLLAGGAALALALAGFMAATAWRLHSDARAQLTTLAGATAFNVQAALAFGDTAEALAVLGSLQADRSIVSACVVRADGSPFATLRIRPVAGGACRPDPKSTSHLFRPLHVEQAVAVDGEILGRLHIHANPWPEIGHTLLLYGALLTVLALMALLVAALLGKILGGRATAPIIDLAQTARQVSEHKDYALRATQRGNDEVGQLVQRFNEMLMQIESRDSALKKQQETLEQQVAERTAELNDAKAAAEAASRAKSRFLAAMSHEIRTPLNGVLGMTELLMEAGLTEEQKHFAETAHNSGEALLTIINDILDFSKIEAGRMELEAIDFNPAQHAEDTIDLLTDRACRKGLEMITDIAPDLPGTVRGDPNRLRQVLINLLGNAIKFTERGEVCVRLTATRQDDHVELDYVVSDTGIGMDREAQARLFAPFVQADSSHARRFGGTGLGLAIARQLVEMMGGWIEVSSELGKGSQFHFRVRLAAAPDTAPQPRVPVNLVGLHALVVDDHPANREILQRKLASLGVQVETAGDGESALRALRAATQRQQPFHVALIDLRMPDMSGIELAGAMRREELPKQPELVLVASLIHAGESQAAREAGFGAILHKPVRHRELLDALGTGRTAPGTHPLVRESALPALQGMRVLLAEDTPASQAVARAMLGSIGVDVDVVANGREALAALAQRGYDAVLMDCHMPELDGFAATRELRRRDCRRRDGGHLPVIAITAGVFAEEQQACMDSGMDDFLPKPFRRAALWSMLARWSAKDGDGNASS